MRSTNSQGSWWQAFVRALDEMADSSPYHGLAARVAQLEERVATLDHQKLLRRATSQEQGS